MKPAQISLFKSLKRLAPLALALTGLHLQANAAQALSFKLNSSFDTTTLQGAQALAGFQDASALWSSILTDDVTINLDIGFGPLDPGIVGSAGSSSVFFDYGTIQQALKADATSAKDKLASQNLPTGPDLSFLTTQTDTGKQILDNNGSINNQFLEVNTATAKALGLTRDVNGTLLDSIVSDASISFSSNFGFDFDRSDDIGADQFDFVGVAAHEIGHALGFVSGVDTVDIYSSPNGLLSFQEIDLDDFAVASILDLFRYSEDSLKLGSLDLAPSNESFFSLDGGKTSLGLFSTGQFNGDGRQASHWKDNLGLGLMDPTVARGELLSISRLDAQAFDVMGWNATSAAVPEPSSWAGLAVLTLVGLFQQKRSTKSRPLSSKPRPS